MTGSPIRLATTADASELARLLSTLGDPLTAEDVAAVWNGWTDEGNLALVVDGDAGLLGALTLHRMVVLHRPKPVGRITSLVIDPAARGRGLGRALVAAAEATMARAGCGMLEVTSHVRRTEAHTFYAHLGYDRTSFRFAKVFEEGAPPKDEE